jgi:hypothetical protein
MDSVSYMNHIIGSATAYRISYRDPLTIPVACSNFCQKFTRNMLVRVVSQPATVVACHFGKTNTTANVSAGGRGAVAVKSATNRIYVLNLN